MESKTRKMVTKFTAYSEIQKPKRYSRRTKIRRQNPPTIIRIHFDKCFHSSIWYRGRYARIILCVYYKKKPPNIKITLLFKLLYSILQVPIMFWKLEHVLKCYFVPENDQRFHFYTGFLKPRKAFMFLGYKKLKAL